MLHAETADVHAPRRPEMEALAEDQRGLVVIMSQKQATLQRGLRECENSM